LKLLSEQSDKNVIILRNRKEGATFLKEMIG
ncbi:topology modulation protein, partial [Turicibacter sanguinis]|nr:topology modulation protein [Turicibacter sanguinis]